MNTVLNDSLLRRLQRHDITAKSLRRFALFLPLCVFALVMLLQSIPVLGFFEVESTRIHRDENGRTGAVRLSMVGYKIRDCTLVPESQSGQMRTANGPWREVDFDWNITQKNSKRKHHSKAAGFVPQWFGVWQWKVTENEATRGLVLDRVTQVRATMSYQCDARVRTSVVGPINLDRFSEIYFDANSL